MGPTPKELYERIDFHVHTHFSKCADRNMIPADMIKRFEGKGYTHLGFSDHLNSSEDLENIAILKKDIALLTTPIQIFLGCEIDLIAPGKITMGKEIRNHVDFVLLSATHYQSHVDFYAPKSLEPEDVADNVFRMFEAACSIPYADVIAHPFSCFGLSRYLPGDLANWEGREIDISYLVPMIMEMDIEEALDKALKSGIAMEISPKSMNPQLLDGILDFYALCKEMGLKFSIGDDTHSVDTIGTTGMVKYIIKKLDINEDDLWLPVKMTCSACK